VSRLSDADAKAGGTQMATTNSSSEAFDLRRMMGEWKLPNLDLDAVAQSQRKNIEALTQANQLALEGTQAWMRRNLELARQGMEDLQAMISDLTKPNGSMEDRLSRQAEFSKKAIEKGLANFRDLADMVTKANTEAMNLLTKRVSESLEEVRDYTKAA
jgi:phasin family protein